MRKITGKKNLIAITGVAVAIILFFIMIRSCGKGTPSKYEYERVTRGTVEKTISVAGILEIINAQRLVAKMGGMIKKVYVDYNDEVRKGQILAVIDAAEIEQRLAKIASQMESSRLELAIAKDDLESKKSMFKDNLISEKGLERAEYHFKTVEARYRQMQLEYNLAAKMMSDTRIVSPVSGVVITRTVEENTPVGPNTPVFVIAPTLSRMRLVMSIDESDIGQIQKGQSLSFTVSAYPERKFNGSITQVRINPIPKGGVITYEAIATCENSEILLKPGMTVSATILVNRREKVLRVPNQALVVSPIAVQPDPNKNYVWRKRKKASKGLPVERIAVEIGVRGDTFTEIKKPLLEGDEVLIKFVKGSGN